MLVDGILVYLLVLFLDDGLFSWLVEGADQLDRETVEAALTRKVDDDLGDSSTWITSASTNKNSDRNKNSETGVGK